MYGADSSYLSVSKYHHQNCKGCEFLGEVDFEGKWIFRGRGFFKCRRCIIFVKVEKHLNFLFYLNNALKQRLLLIKLKQSIRERLSASLYHRGGKIVA